MQPPTAGSQQVQPLEVPRDGFEAVRREAHPAAYVALDPERADSRSLFLLPRAFMLECGYVAELLNDNDAGGALDVPIADPLLDQEERAGCDGESEATAAPPLPAMSEPVAPAFVALSPSVPPPASAAPSSSTLRQQAPGSQPAVRRPSDAFTCSLPAPAAVVTLPQPDDEDDDGAEALLIVPLPARFTDVDVRLLAAYAGLPARTPLVRLERLDAAGFLRGISASEEALLVRMEAAASEILPLPAAGNTGPETAGSAHPGLPRLDLMLRLAALADFLLLRQLSALLAGAVAHMCYDRTVPELRMLLYPQLRLVPRAYFNGLLGPSITPQPQQPQQPQQSAEEEEEPASPLRRLRVFSVEEAATATTADIGRSRAALAGEEPLVRVRVDVATSDHAVLEERDVVLPVFFTRDAQKRIREEVPPWLNRRPPTGAPGDSAAAAVAAEVPLHTAFAAWAV